LVRFSRVGARDLNWMHAEAREPFDSPCSLPI
jgi:hypothetical protein